MRRKPLNNELVTKNYLTQQLTKFRDKILNAVDAVMKEVVAMREEQTLHFHQHERIDERLENHGGRLKKLEGREFV